MHRYKKEESSQCFNHREDYFEIIVVDFGKFPHSAKTLVVNIR